ncbi:Spc7 kinetochore protein-domain-containing protein, partial [Zychaea mexicana]|uniref:Spc7 kinetochore protein-domain-containing protein n=1 Tax=Zychaea mexicana TaxID=64656 RepID=UPI0022FED667
NILDEELSQLYDSSNEIGELSPPSPPPPPPSRNIPLSEFLLYISISFGDSTVEYDRRRTSDFSTSEEPVRVSEQAVAAATTIPELEMYKTHCGELKELIAADEEVIARIDREVSASNPSLFKEYLDADLNVQNDIEARLKKTKDYAGFKALHTLLEWKQTKNDSLKWNLEPCVQNITEEEQYHEAFGRRIEDSSYDLQKHLAELKQKLADARTRLEERRQVVYADANKQNEINEQRATLDGYRADIAQLAEKESSVMGSIRQLNRRKEQLEAETAKLEQEQGVTVHPESFLQRAQEKFEKSSRYSRLRVIERSDEVISVEIMGDILVQIKSPSQFPRQPDAVQISILNESFYGRISPLVNGLHAMIKGLENTNQIIETAAIYWNQARGIYRELIRSGARYFMEINPLETENESEQWVRCTLVPTSFIHRTKVTITIDLRPQDISKFPVINMEAVTVTYNRGPTDIAQEQVENIARDLLRRHGFVNLKGVLQEILEQIRSNPTFPNTPLLQHM